MMSYYCYLLNIHTRILVFYFHIYKETSSFLFSYPKNIMSQLLIHLFVIPFSTYLLVQFIKNRKKKKKYHRGFIIVVTKQLQR